MVKLVKEQDVDNRDTKDKKEKKRKLRSDDEVILSSKKVKQTDENEKSPKKKKKSRKSDVSLKSDSEDESVKKSKNKKKSLNGTMETDSVDGSAKKSKKKNKKKSLNGTLDTDKNGASAESDDCNEVTVKTGKEKKKKKSKASEENGVPSPKPKKLKKSKNDTLNEEEETSDKESKKAGTDEVKMEVDEVVKNKEDSGGEESVPVNTTIKSQLAVDGDFSKFNIQPNTVKKLIASNINYLFPVQTSTFSSVYEGKDVVAQARTGTGKTLAFALPLVEKLQLKDENLRYGRSPRVLVMAPTRELAKQVSEVFESISEGLAVLCVYGGTPYGPQEQKIREGLDVIVGTPGRMMDFAEKGTLRLDSVKHAVLDEVDRMLDMGFADIVEQVLNFAYNRDDGQPCAGKPQTLLFSATLPDWVHTTASKYMGPNTVKLDLVGTADVRTSTTVQHFAIKCSYFDRASTIGNVLSVYSGQHGRAMVFCQTKRDADELTLSTAIKQETHVMHGDIPQEKREKVLKSFREGRYKCLITTDVAARGLDIPEVDLVVQCSPPKDVDSYIHRSGRTGRAGRAGISVLFYKPKEEYDLQCVERKAAIKFKRIGPPTAQDLIDAAANDVIRSLEGISAETLAHFEKSAERMIKEKGAVSSLSAALAVISGNTEIKSRSLINSYEGSTTYLFRTTVNMSGKGYCWSALGRCLLPEVLDKVKGMRFCEDKMGCVFDLPSEFESVVEDRWKDGNFDTLKKATELPPLLEEEFNSSFSGSGGGNRSFGGSGRGSWGRGGGSGGGSWGRGGGSRGRGSRGGGRGGGGRGRGGFRR